MVDFVVTVSGGGGQQGQAQLRTGAAEVRSQRQLSAPGAGELVRRMRGAVHGGSEPTTSWQSIAEQVKVSVSLCCVHKGLSDKHFLLVSVCMFII